MTWIVYSDTVHRYAEVRPCDGEWTWDAGTPEYATPMDTDAAERLAAVTGGRLVEDPYRRQPSRLLSTATRLAERKVS